MHVYAHTYVHTHLHIACLELVLLSVYTGFYHTAYGKRRPFSYLRCILNIG